MSFSSLDGFNLVPPTRCNRRVVHCRRRRRTAAQVNFDIGQLCGFSIRSGGERERGKGAGVRGGEDGTEKKRRCERERGPKTALLPFLGKKGPSSKSEKRKKEGRSGSSISLAHSLRLLPLARSGALFNEGLPPPLPE